MRALTSSVSLLAILLASTPASAQPLPGFGTMDRFDEQTKFATSLTYISFDDDVFGADLTAVRLDLFGQYTTPEGYGGYVMVPFNRISVSSGGESDSESGLGNLELGGLKMIPGDIPVILRGGISLDTADSDTGGLGVFGRFTDLTSDIGGATWLRLSASPLIRRGNSFFRADFGIDVPISEDDGVDFLTLGRVNIGGGIETGELALIGELLSSFNIEEDSNDEREMVNMLGVTARWLGAGQLQPHVTFQIPLDDEFEEVLDWNLVVGLEYVIGATDVSSPAGSPPPAFR